MTILETIAPNHREILRILVDKGYIKIRSSFLELLQDQQTFYKKISPYADYHDMEDEVLLQYNHEGETYVVVVYPTRDKERMFHYVVKSYKDYYGKATKSQNFSSWFSLDKACTIILRIALSHIEKANELKENEKAGGKTE